MTATRNARAFAACLLLALALPTGAGADPGGKGAVQADYDPSMGVRVNSPDGAVQLTAPTGALDKAATFSHEAIDPPTPSGNLRLTRAFKLEAAGNDKQPIHKFARPLHLVVKYDDAEVSKLKVKPSALRLFYQDDATSVWHLVPTAVDASGHALRADVDHFTTFGAGTAGVSDAFDRGDSATTLGTATSGQAWRTDGTTWGVCANAGCAIGPAGGGNYVHVDSGGVAQDVAVTVQPRTGSAVGQAGILADVTTDWSTNLLYVGLDPGGLVEVWTLVNGTWSNGAIARQQTSNTGASAHVLEAQAGSGSLTVLIDGAAVLGPIAVPTPPADATNAGLFVDTTEPSGAWPRYNDFQAIPTG